MDPNGNGFLSLAEADLGIQRVLECNELYNAKPVIIRAFSAAKNLSGKETGAAADYIEQKEFRAFLSYLRQYFEYWIMFQRIDTTHDSRMEFNEFKRALPELTKWGVEVRNPEKTWQELDANGNIA
jgi:hypothetical protein